MIFKIYAVHDSKAEAFLTPFFMPTRAMAQRIFEQMVVNPEHQFSLSPADYTLFELGQFDDQDAGLSAQVLHNVINGVQVNAEVSDGAHLLTGTES